MKTTDLKTTLYNASLAQLRLGSVDPTHIANAFFTYAEYFKSLANDPDQAPPTSTVAAIDDLLLALWDVIVDREEQQLDRHVCKELNAHYADAFNGLLEESKLSSMSEEEIAIGKARLTEILEVISAETGLSIIVDAAISTLPPEAQEAFDNLGQIEDDKLSLLLRKLYLKHPQNLALNALYTSVLDSPEAVLAHTTQWGEPIDPGQVGHLDNGSIHLLDFVILQEAYLTVYAARGSEYLMLQSLQYLMDLNTSPANAEARVDYLLMSKVQAELMRGNFIPLRWKAPVPVDEFPDASRYLLERWEVTIEELIEELNGMIPGLGVDDLDLEVPQGLFQVKVSLQDIKPPIWRRLLVPANIQLADLHRVIQVTMGWDNVHLHQFTTKTDNYGPDAEFGYMTSYEGLPLNILLQRPKDKIIYEYDFGDSWRHEILLEKVIREDVAVPAESVRVRCIKGKRACPPEDCGGVGGYYAVLHALDHRELEENAEYLEWIGDDFHPERFEPQRVNSILARMVV